MEPDVIKCVEIIREIAPEEANTISSQSLTQLAQQIYRNSPELNEQVKARSNKFNPRAPIYLFIQEIVTYCCVIYSIIEVIEKIDKVTTLLLDHNAQENVVKRAIDKLRLIGLDYPAIKVEKMRDRILEYLTRPKSSP